MLTDPPPPGPRPLELLVVGGLTIDRFPDGSQAPGGSVLHAARAMFLDGRRTAIATIAGPEPTAQAGLSELREIAEVRAQRVERTITFEHRDVDGMRQLTLRANAGPVPMPPLAEVPRAVLYAGIAHEVDPNLGGAFPDALTGAILQGWLRELRPGARVDARPLDRLEPALVSFLAGSDLLVASVDDLLADAAAPEAQLAAMRATFGPRPTIALTAGLDGAWLSMPDGGVERLRVAHPIEGVPTVGAGDAFAAALLAGMSRGVPTVDAALDAAELVAEVLADRGGRQALVTGDVHGMLDELLGALRGAGLVDAAGSWSGGRSELWFTGDLADRGSQGIGVIELVMRLQSEARAAGGRVGCVLGNHEVQLLAAREMPDGSTSGVGGTFRSHWQANGGLAADLERLTDDQAAWLRALPVAARVGPTLVVHSDSTRYPRLARSVTGANARVRGVLEAPRPGAWDELLADLAERRSFVRDEDAAARLLSAWGGREVVHGHTPVRRLFDDRPGGARPSGDPGAVRYAEGRAVAVDGGVVAGGDVILYRVPRYADLRA